ncbi:MAG: hypothetical protein AVO39_11515 [delta proteobacterium MLS_D]|nr:MAG: hypothetical protein AVO39_11515 [delta proteobacterium MLS_D]
MLLQHHGGGNMRPYKQYATIFMLSVWGFVIVIVSFLFLYAGIWIDRRFDTQPTFTLGLFILAIFLSIGRFYWEVWRKKNIR